MFYLLSLSLKQQNKFLGLPTCDLKVKIEIKFLQKNKTCFNFKKLDKLTVERLSC